MTVPDGERQKLRQLIERAGVAMLTTLDDTGRPVGRPMLPLLFDGDGDIYFLTHYSSRKVAHVNARPQVALSVSAASGCHISVVGSASAAQDPLLIDRLWRPTYRAWFPDGRGDGQVTVLRVTIERIDYWEPPRGRLSRLFQAAKAVLTRRAVETPMKTIDRL